MVRYSSGCRNCVKRRVRCDECKPICRNCRRIGLECGGPRNGVVFVHDRQSIALPQTGDQNHESGVRNRKKSNVLNLTGTRQQPIHLVQHIARTPCKTDEVIPFLQAFWQTEDKPWIEACLLKPGCYSTAFVAVESLAAAYYGKRRRDSNVIKYAKLKYVEALEALQIQLNRPDLHRKVNFDVLAASTALSRYEVLICSSFKAWLHHSSGISKAIELLGPDAFREYPNRYIVEANWYRIVQEAYHHRRRTFLEQEKWKQLQLNVGRLDSSAIELQDLFIRLAGLAEDVTCHLRNPVTKQCEAPMILVEVELFLSALQDWASSQVLPMTERVAHDSSTGKPNDNVYVDEGGICFQTLLRYPSLEAASEMNIWRSIKITVLEWRYKLLHPCWWAGEDHEGMAEIPGIHELATDICRSIHHHFFPPGCGTSILEDSQSRNTCFRAGVREMFGLLFSANSAHKVFNRRSREARWLEMLLEKVAERTGVDLSRNLLKAFPTKWKDGIIINTGTNSTA